MTKGPLIPPMVLYRILGVTLNDDDSLGSPMMAADSDFEDRGWRRKSGERLNRAVQLLQSCRVVVGKSKWEVGELRFLGWSFKLSSSIEEAAISEWV